MKYMNKVGSMLNKKVSMNNKGEENANKPAGVHVLGEDYFPQDNLMISEEIGNNNLKEEKPSTVPMSSSSNDLPTVSKKKAVSSSMTEILGISKQPQAQKKTKQQIEESEFMKGFTLINGEKTIHSDKCNVKLDKELIPCKVLMTNYRVYILPDFKKKLIGELSYNNYFPQDFFHYKFIK